MTTNEIRQKFLDFFTEKGHAVIPSASVVPENDPTVLFTTAGMQPLVPYLLGQKHPMGNRIVDSQKCVRTDDIDEVGDNRHLTFFEMLGNWSLGDYFKQEAITWSFEFLTSKEWLGIDPKKIYVTVFEGDADAPQDDESIGIWESLFETVGIAAELGNRIRAYPKKKNWWGPAGATGPCGPDTEIFYDTGKNHNSFYGETCHQNCDCGKFVEIWNNVFMQYEKLADGTFVALKQKNVDTGMGLERISAVIQNVDTIFETDAFQPVIAKIASLSSKSYAGNERAFRIIADHLRAVTFIIGDQRSVSPSNVGQGYIVRRLLRRAIREGRRLGILDTFTYLVAEVYIGEYGGHYTELTQNFSKIVDELKKEEEKFGKTLEKGMKELEKMLIKGSITGEGAFLLFSSYGFPLELTEEILREKGESVDRVVFQSEFKKHQELSRSSSAGSFKGGLADNSVETTRLHTATHLLHQALRTVLGDHVEQKGSNITAERLRFDFSHGQKMTPEQMLKVEELVNEAIKKDYPVHCEQLSVDDAKKRGAIGLFEDKYAQMGGKINVYFIGNEDKGFFSKEICGGPHVERTEELGSLKIQKEEAVSAGVRRIKAICYPA